MLYHAAAAGAFQLKAAVMESLYSMRRAGWLFFSILFLLQKYYRAEKGMFFMNNMGIKSHYSLKIGPSILPVYGRGTKLSEVGN